MIVTLTIARRTLMLVALFSLAPVAAAQSASSTTYFLPGSERAPGGPAASATYRLEASLGAGVVAEWANSANFRLLGGFNAVSQAPVAGQPWVSGVLPLFAPLLGGTTHTVHGHELALGVATNVTIGGQAATVLNRSRDKVVVQAPAQTAPGWKPVVTTNGGGVAHLSPRGMCVLPMCELASPIDMGQPWRLTYRGTQGDTIYIAVTSARLPFAVPIPPYHHGLELNLGALIGIIGPLPVTNANGAFHLDFPGFFFARPIYVQMLGVPGAAPGYAPGSLTNTISL